MGNPPAPEGYPWSLGLLYLVWAVAIVILYFACRWFADLNLVSARPPPNQAVTAPAPDWAEVPRRRQ
jgi:hypothetical protein